MITIVDYDAGNPRSIINMLAYLGVSAELTGDPDTVAKAGHLILPGVGKFDWGMRRLHDKGLAGPLDEAVKRGVPILGICLGAQLLTRGSEEGELPGLGWIPARTVAFDRSQLDARLKVPHIGWADTEWAAGRRMTVSTSNPRYYYVHGFHIVCDDPTTELCRAEHGYGFTAGVEQDNVFGVQFHPEKSLSFGMAVLRHFAGL
ncbi:imidazole glycerol phosphate synthase subunit HisH [Sphingopyxis sp. PET50]|uniref:imidazole glycerol phosphate synthase subunit HisH n=1 Tax=Sphingopyxis sp. PET50 TaxID=2976533 RepID=UPI0021B00BDB|nr:imidazole glycerol phosphate synthase subunit HisH [Sphingopyxis sp. PET50]